MHLILEPRLDPSKHSTPWNGILPLVVWSSDVATRDVPDSEEVETTAAAHAATAAARAATAAARAATAAARAATAAARAATAAARAAAVDLHKSHHVVYGNHDMLIVSCLLRRGGKHCQI